MGASRPPSPSRPSPRSTYVMFIRWSIRLSLSLWYNAGMRVDGKGGAAFALGMRNSRRDAAGHASSTTDNQPPQVEEPTEAGTGEGTKVSETAEQVADMGEDETSVVVVAPAMAKSGRSGALLVRIHQGGLDWGCVDGGCWLCAAVPPPTPCPPSLPPHDSYPSPRVVTTKPQQARTWSPRTRTASRTRTPRSTTRTRRWARRPTSPRTSPPSSTVRRVHDDAAIIAVLSSVRHCV